MSTWDEEQAEVLAIYKHTQRECSDELRMYDLGMSLYAEAIESAPRVEKSDFRLVQMGFISQAFNFMYASIDLAQKGMYYQSISALRFVYESWVTFWYLQQYPTDGHRWLKPVQDRGAPKVERMVNKIKHPTKGLMQKVIDHRKVLNRFAHSDGLAIRYLFDIEGEQLVVRWGITYDRKKFDGCGIMIAVWLGQMLDIVSSWMPEGSEWRKGNERYTEWALTYVGSVTGEGAEE